MKQKRGELLNYLRNCTETAQEELCYGLCALGVYSKYESGKQEVNRLLFYALLQRMGKNPDKFSDVLAEEEYVYFAWKNKVLSAAHERDLAELKRCLVTVGELKDIIDENLHQQFWLQMQAVLAEYEDASCASSIMLMRQAIQLTVPDIQIAHLGNYLISAEEMRLLLELGRLLVKAKRLEEAKTLLLAILDYVDRRYSDYELKIRVYPEAVRLLVPILLDRGCEAEGMVLCKKAIELLCRNGVLYDLLELLDLYLACSKNLADTMEAKRYAKQAEALRQVYAIYDAKGIMRKSSSLAYCNHELYLVQEMMRRGRKSLGMSQETLSEDICAPETVSRIENGRRPSNKNKRAIIKKLNAALGYHDTELDTEDFRLLEKKAELSRYMSLHRWKEAKKLLAELKIGLDMNSSYNQRIIGIKEQCIKFYEKEISPEQFRAYCEAYMKCEREGWREEKFWEQFFTLDKINAMNCLATTYARNGQHDKAIYILEHLLWQLLDSKVALKDRNRSAMILIGNLSSWYGENGQLDKCIDMCNFGINFCMECGKGKRLGKFLGNQAEATNEKENKSTEKSRHFFELAYYISDLFSVHMAVSYTDTYYRMHYDEDIKWY